MIKSKLPEVGTTIFTVMTRLANAHGAINLSQGFPDFQPPEALQDAVAAALHQGENQYAPMIGHEGLRQQIASLVAERYGASCDPAEEITVTAGATEALFAAIHATAGPGDEVIVFDPCYDSYDPAIRLAGARCIHLPLQRPDFSIDFDRLKQALNARTRLIIINSPHNPSGALLGTEDLDRLADLLRPYNCVILSDEVYEHIVFDGARHHSVIGHNELAARSYAVFSFGKTFHATGWKVGYCIAPKTLTAEFRKVHQFLMFAVSTPVQSGIARFLAGDSTHYRDLGLFYQRYRDHFTARLEGSGLRLLPCSGTYFLLADYSDLSALPDTEFVRELTVEHGVAAIPVSVFSAAPDPAERIIRLCFAKHFQTLDNAAERLAKRATGH